MVASLPDLDVAIVGGGIGGIYAGWRLLTSDLAGSQTALWAQARGSLGTESHGKLKLAVLEGSDRVGGRLLSARAPSLPSTTAEIGGMRYVFPDQKLITSLVEDVLDLPWHAQTVDVDSNIAFLRGKLLRTRDLADPTAMPYFFDGGEAAWLTAHAQNPTGLVTRVLEQLIPGLASHLADRTLREYLQGVTIGGQALWKHGFWNLLAPSMSPDGYTAARATAAYDCLTGNYNALDLTAEFYDFGANVSYRMVDGGYEAVPYHLRRGFEAAGGTVQYHTWLDWFDAETLPDGSQGVRLYLKDGSSLTARAILLAMPRRSIELLQAKGPVLGPTNAAFRQDLNAVSAIPLFKLFLLYEECWWQQSKVSTGRSLTDMPIRQCYYWPNGPAGEVIPEPADSAMIMAYDDLLNVGFWGGLDSRPTTHAAGDWNLFRRGSHAHTPALPPEDPYARRLLENWRQHGATVQMVTEMHRQLMQMHGVDKAPAPIDAAYMDWSRDPYGGGVHLWNPNYNSAELLIRMTQPLAGFPCYLCGEAYSTNQTWAEGALQTAEIVLQRRLGLARASWQKAAVSA